jgi:hypothetical protein
VIALDVDVMHLDVIVVIFIRIIVSRYAVGTRQNLVVSHAHPSAGALLNDVRYRNEQSFVTGTAETRTRLLHAGCGDNARTI